MWDEQKRTRFNELRSRTSERLSAPERAELAALTRELEADEARYLKAANQALRQERETIEARNRILNDLAGRKESLLRRLRAFLAEAEAERRAIERELAAVLANPSRSPGL